MSESSHENQEARYLERKAIWDRTREQLELVTDALGKPIDEGIKETVVACMVRGLHSNGSCEGHVREQFGYTAKLCPYVSLGAPEPDMRFVGEEDIRKAVMEQYDVASIREIYAHREILDDYWGRIYEGDMKETEEYLAVREKNNEYSCELQELLMDFYADRPYSEDTGLVVTRVGTYVRVTTRNMKVKQPKGDIELAACRAELEKEQSEMHAFTGFIKKRFFNS